MAVDEIGVAGSPRLAGEDLGHVEALARSGEDFEPVLVHRGTGLLVDGRHRLLAARLRGDRDIAVRFWDGPESELFAHAVEVNVKHGLPLTTADRRAAALRLLREHPSWSDRRITQITGISPKTVARLRRDSTEEVPQSNTRVGRDGRRRPVDGAEGRRAALAFLAQRPDASLREVARAAGIATSTAHQIRRRLRADAEPAAPVGPVAPAASTPDRAPRETRSRVDDRDARAILRTLMRDPSLRFSESGRDLLRWLTTRAVDARTGSQLAAAVPPHCVPAVADLAVRYAKEWSRLAERLSAGERPEL
ncbi:helix-turn-helix domain-containing protein [Streptomyces sp. BBFR2]|uniref:ParB/RepB/Spo0J family partition protein n=1 Tax=Streptomyces sp. BBFR2 TaxID=3372854 RepID=UPI0037DA0412